MELFFVLQGMGKVFRGKPRVLGLANFNMLICISSVQSLSHVQLFAAPWTAACQLSITSSQSLLKLMSIELVMPSNHLLCHPLLLPCSVFSSIRVFSNESFLQVAKVLEFWGTDSGAYFYSQEKMLRYTSLDFSRQNSTVVKHLRKFFGVKQQNKTKVKFQEWLWHIKASIGILRKNDVPFIIDICYLYKIHSFLLWNL